MKALWSFALSLQRNVLPPFIFRFPLFDVEETKRHLCHFFKSQFFVTKSPSGLLNGRKMSPALKRYKRYPPLPHIHSHLCIFLWKNDEPFSLWSFLI
jgi:hypothetical protein